MVEGGRVRGRRGRMTPYISPSILLVPGITRGSAALPVPPTYLARREGGVARCSFNAAFPSAGGVFLHRAPPAEQSRPERGTTSDWAGGGSIHSSGHGIRAHKVALLHLYVCGLCAFVRYRGGNAGVPRGMRGRECWKYKYDLRLYHQDLCGHERPWHSVRTGVVMECSKTEDIGPVCHADISNSPSLLTDTYSTLGKTRLSPPSPLCVQEAQEETSHFPTDTV